MLPFVVLCCLTFFTLALAQSTTPYTVTGTVRDETGRLLSDSTVCAIPMDRDSVRVDDKICAETHGQGEFTINLTQAGKYQITGEKMSEGYMPSYLPFYRDPQRPIPEIIVSDDRRSASVSLALGPKSGLITGKVKDEVWDTPVEDFVVWLSQARNPSARYHQVVKGSHSLGRFKLFAPSVPFRLRVAAEGYEEWVMGGGVLVSANGPRKGPGTLLVRAGSTADFAIYLKRKNQTEVGPTNKSNAKRLPAPVQLIPPDNSMFDLFPRTTRLEWSPVSGAATYAVEVETCWRQSSISSSRLPDDEECINPSPFVEKIGLLDTSFEFTFKGAQPGRWRVWAIGRDHEPGSKSSWRRFVYQR